MGDVIDFISRKKIKDSQVLKTNEKDSLKISNFFETVKINEENKNRIKKERIQANKNVIKSYRIK